LLKFFLELLSFVVLSKALVPVPFNLFLYFGDLIVQGFVLLSELVDVLTQSKVPFFSLDEIRDKLIDILSTCGFQNSIERFLILLELSLWYHTGDFVLAESPECLLTLPFEVDFFLSLRLSIKLF
jgi:hypothetical protein